MIPLNLHMRSQLVMIVAFGCLAMISVALFSETRNASTVVGWCLAVFWTLALLGEGFRRVCLWKAPDMVIRRSDHRILLALCGVTLLHTGVDRVVGMAVFRREAELWWSEQYLFSIVSDSYGSILFIVVCIGTAMAAIGSGFLRLRALGREASLENGGSGKDLFFVLIVILIVATFASPVQDVNNYDSFLDNVFDAWYMSQFVDNGPIQVAIYALIWFINVTLTSWWLRKTTRLATLRALLLVISLWAIPTIINAARFGVQELLLFDRADELAWTTMLIPAGLYVVHGVPLLIRHVVRLWKGEA